MNHSVKRAAAAALVAGGLLTATVGTADAASAAQRTTSRDQLSAGIRLAVAAEQARGVIVSGCIGGRLQTPADTHQS